VAGDLLSGRRASTTPPQLNATKRQVDRRRPAGGGPCHGRSPAVPRLARPGPARQAFPAVNYDGPKILFLSRLHEKKGVDLLIDAVARLVAQGLRPRLLIAGTGDPAYESQLRAQRDRLA